MTAFCVPREVGVEAEAELEQRGDAAADSKLPPVGCVVPARILSSVLLPAPFAPMMPTASPAATSKLTSRSTQRDS